MAAAPSSLFDVLLCHVSDEHDDLPGLSFWNPAARSYDTVPYKEMAQRAFAFGSRLVGSDRANGSVCLIACHSPYATLVAFLGAISVASVPMILPMPRALGSQQALAERIEHWAAKFNRPCSLVLEQGLEEKFHSAVPAALTTFRVSDSPLAECDTTSQPARDRVGDEKDIAFFQTTSSSTGEHKAVAISHNNVLSNVRGIRNAVGMDGNEKMISWLPLFHDMGLVGAVLFSLCNGYPLYLMTPTQFLKRPALWLRGISEKRCSITTAPNFGYDYCSRLVSAKDAQALDLSCVKHFFIGAEPIRVSTIRGFCQKFATAGVRSHMIRPAYGLAESTIITTISRPNGEARFIRLDAASVGLGQEVRVLKDAGLPPNSADHADADTYVTVCTAGSAIDGMRISLADEAGETIEQNGCAGEIVIQGDSVALGYVTGGPKLIDRFNHKKTRTGDMGVIIDGELFIIERIKNVIIRSGENFLVSAMEQRLADVLQISHENVAVFESNIHDPGSEIVVLIEKHSSLAPDQIDSVLRALSAESFPVDVILLHRARVIPRTTSGKKRHFFCRQLFLNGALSFQQKIEVSPDRVASASLHGSA